MIGLLDSLDRDRAIWIGHDWGSPVVWNIASHHPDRCHGIANLCVPYYTLERGLKACLPLVNRERYPEDKYPAGQWEYMRFYEENFEKARSTFEANPYNTAKLLFRKGSPDGFGKVTGTAMTRITGGWFGNASEAPDFPMDEDVLTIEDLEVYASALKRNGFFGHWMAQEKPTEVSAAIAKWIATRMSEVWPLPRA